MKIGFVADTGYNFISGAARSTQRFCKLLSEKGHDIIIFTSRKKGQNKLEYDAGVKLYRFSGVPLPQSQKEAHLALPFFYLIFQKLKKENIDVLHVTEPTFLGFSSIVAARILGIPIVVTSHIQSENVAYNTGMNKKWTQWVFDRYLILFYGDANLIIFPSDFARKLLYDKGLKTPYKVISNGVDIMDFRPRDIDEFRRVKKLESKKLILTVGRLMVEKSVDTIIKALPSVLKKVPNTHLVIVGNGTQKKKLQVLVREKGIAKYVTFAGLISEDDLRNYHSAADLYVSASLVELEGMSVLEAMASGSPVIVSDSKDSAAPELVSGNGRVFKAQSSRDLSQNIVDILNSDDLRDVYSKKSLALAKDYDIHASVKKLEKAYKDLKKDKKNTF